MLKFELTSGSVLLSMIFGLVSCGPNEKPKDIYRLPSPLIIRAGPPESHIGFREFDMSSDHVLKLHDQIDISEKKPLKTIVTSRCQSSAGSFQQTREFKIDRLFLFQMVPQEVLLQNLIQAPVTCGFEVSAFNDSGSNHIFNLMNVVVTEQPATDIPIESKAFKTNEHLLRIKNRQSPEATIHYNHKTDVSMKVICEDLSFASILFNHIKNLADIDLRVFAINSNKSPVVADQRPLQKCRALILRDELPIAMSERFEVLLPRSPLALMEELPKVTASGTPQAVLKENQPVVLANHWLFNPGKQVRYLKITKEKSIGFIKTYFHIRKSHWGQNHMQKKWFSFQVSNGELIRRQKDADTYAIRPSGSIQVQTVVEPEAGLSCTIGFIHRMALGATIQAPAMPAVEEVDLEGHVLESIQLSPSPELTIGDQRPFASGNAFSHSAWSGGCP